MGGVAIADLAVRHGSHNTAHLYDIAVVVIGIANFCERHDGGCKDRLPKGFELVHQKAAYRL